MDDSDNCEFGGFMRIANMRAIFYDGNGNEVEPPKCEKCGGSKSPVFGKESMGWVCVRNCNSSPGSLVYRKDS